MNMYNSRGNRIGQYHHMAKLTDRDVDAIFELREQGLTLVEIAARMDCGKTTVFKILKGLIRTDRCYLSRREVKTQ